MEYSVSQLLKASVGATRRAEVETALPSIDEFAAGAPIRGSLKLTRTGRGVLVDARLSTAARVNCSRCLGELMAPLQLRIREEFLPTVDVVTGLPAEVPDGDEAFTIDEHHILDLGEAVRQYALLDLPLQPLCRPDCAGLCPYCGQNLNEGRCACSDQEGDSRLAPLASLLSLVEDKE